MYLLCKSIYITHPSTLLDIITFMDCNYISFFCHSDASIFRIKSNRVSNGLDTTFILNEVFVLASMSYFENAVCMCVAQKNEMQNKERDLYLLLSRWHAIFKTMFF